MKYLKLFLLTLLLTIGFIFPSCDRVNCNCGDYAYFDVRDISLESFSDFNSGTQIEEKDTISFSELDFILLTVEAEYIAAQIERNWSFSLMNSAMACSCLGGYKGSKTERIENLSIVTLNDFDDEHLADSEISELFDINRGENFQSANPISIADFLKQEKDSEANMQEQAFAFVLKKAPTINSTLSIKIRLELSTGEIYETTNDPFIITP